MWHFGTRSERIPGSSGSPMRHQDRNHAEDVQGDRTDTQNVEYQLLESSSVGGAPVAGVQPCPISATRFAQLCSKWVDLLPQYPTPGGRPA
jgi:hypothetical protein